MKSGLKSGEKVVEGDVARMLLEFARWSEEHIGKLTGGLLDLEFSVVLPGPRVVDVTLDTGGPRRPGGPAGPAGGTSSVKNGGVTRPMAVRCSWGKLADLLRGRATLFAEVLGGGVGVSSVKKNFTRYQVLHLLLVLFAQGRQQAGK
ncbi:MAG: hypothetical protein ACTSU5_02000 [Promethearchaeota archaeon]